MAIHKGEDSEAKWMRKYVVINSETSQVRGQERDAEKTRTQRENRGADRTDFLLLATRVQRRV